MFLTVWGASAILTLVAAGWIPATAQAQSALFSQAEDAVGVGVWYGWGRFSVNAPSDLASDEVKGYTDILPSKMTGVGPALGVSFSSFGLNIGVVSAEEDLEAVRADVNQTPGNSTDDVTVLSMVSHTTSITFLYQPLRFLYLGYGSERGTIEFIQLSAGGMPERKKLPIDNKFYSVGLAIGFDPTQGKVAPILTVFGKIPADQSDFNGSSYGAGIGLFF